jgi:hypothetical protein
VVLMLSLLAVLWEEHWELHLLRVLQSSCSCAAAMRDQVSWNQLVMLCCGCLPFVLLESEMAKPVYVHDPVHDPVHELGGDTPGAHSRIKELQGTDRY